MKTEDIYKKLLGKFQETCIISRKTLRAIIHGKNYDKTTIIETSGKNLMVNGEKVKEIIPGITIILHGNCDNISTISGNIIVLGNVGNIETVSGNVNIYQEKKLLSWEKKN